MIEKEQALMARVVDLLAQRFDKHAVLRGGMVLRVLGSPRLTNHLDYVFVPYASKKDIVDEVVACLRSMEGVTIKTTLHSTCLRIVLTHDDTTIQIEADVAMEVDTAPISTRLFSTQFQLPARIISVVDYPVALANKMAAWNERRLIRDVYDIWFYLEMNVEPDPAILEARLKRPNYSKLVKKSERFGGESLGEFYAFLRDWVGNLDDQTIEDELADYLKPDEIIGLSAMFRAALVTLR